MASHTPKRALTPKLALTRRYAIPMGAALATLVVLQLILAFNLRRVGILSNQRKEKVRPRHADRTRGRRP